MNESYDAHYIENKAMINALADKMDLVIKNMEKQLEDMHKSMDEQFNKLDKKIDGVSDDLQKLRNDLPKTIDERIKDNTAGKALNLVRWIVITVGGSVFIAVVTRFATQYLGL